MRIHEGVYAYELEHLRDPKSGVHTNWRFTVFRVRPFEEPLARGNRATRNRAEVAAKRVIADLEKTPAGTAA